MAYLIPLVILFGLFWVFVAMPQRRRQRAHLSMQNAVSIGDEVITAGGLHGEVVGLDESVLRIEVAPEVVVRIDRRAIAGRVDAEPELEPEPEPEPEPEQEPGKTAEIPSATRDDAG